MRQFRHILILSTWALPMLASCSDTCEQNQNALPSAGFYAVDAEGQARSVTTDSVAVVGVGLETDSLLSPTTAQISELYMPFRIDTDRTQYVFVATSQQREVRDTVTFDYTRVLRFASAECGVSYVFHIHDISTQGTLIDSVVCPKGFIDNTSGENLRIYFRTE